MATLYVFSHRELCPPKALFPLPERKGCETSQGGMSVGDLKEKILRHWSDPVKLFRRLRKAVCPPEISSGDKKFAAIPDGPFRWTRLLGNTTLSLTSETAAISVSLMLKAGFKIPPCQSLGSGTHEPSKSVRYSQESVLSMQANCTAIMGIRHQSPHLCPG